jgi:hypothetical protein
MHIAVERTAIEKREKKSETQLRNPFESYQMLQISAKAQENCQAAQ